MKREAKLFLIRHGETVDNVAQVYAGSRDSALTNHGHLQATRLGQHLKTLDLSFTHIYSSHLQRAVKTARLVREAQVVPATAHQLEESAPEVIQLPVLMEKDFGAYEGKTFNERRVERKSTEIGEDSKEIESHASLANRANAFLDEHLLPLFDDTTTRPDLCIAIVSHGMFLSVLWKCLLLRFPTGSITLVPELAATPRNSLEVVGWSNTGYLELHMTQELSNRFPSHPVAPSESTSNVLSVDDDKASPCIEGKHATEPGSTAAADFVVNATNISPASTVTTRQSTLKRFDQSWTFLIQKINGKDHLKGLKRTGGGVGSSRHDSSQQSIHSFFKRKKLE